MKKGILRTILTVILIVVFSTSSVMAADASWASDQSWIYNANGTTKTNVRKVAGSSPTGYNVLQGSCNDGNGNFYFAFMSKSNEKIKIAKMQLVDGKFVLVKKTGVLDIYHGNDMTYIPNAGGIQGNDKILITNNPNIYTVTVFDVATMQVEDSFTYQYYKEKNWDDCKFYVEGELIVPKEERPESYVYDPSADAEEEEEDEYCLEDYTCEHHGFSNIAYNPATGQLASGITGCHDLMIYDLKYTNGQFSVKPRAYIIQDRVESTFQGMDCDSNYIYMAWSPGCGIVTNRIYVYDWTGKYVTRYWIDESYEIESISHVGSTFYAGYHHSFIYKWTETVKKKYKWKKVWNADHTKKVWKYKTKKVKVKHSQTRRNAYIKQINLAS